MQQNTTIECFLVCYAREFVVFKSKLETPELYHTSSCQVCELNIFDNDLWMFRGGKVLLNGSSFFRKIEEKVEQAISQSLSHLIILDRFISLLVGRIKWFFFS